MLSINKNNKREQFILHPDVLSPRWLMYSFRTVQINLHLISTGWIPTCNRSKWDQKVLCIDFSLSNFGSRPERTPILPELSPALCSHPVILPMYMLNLGTGLQIQQEPQVSFYSNWPDKPIFKFYAQQGHRFFKGQPSPWNQVWYVNQVSYCLWSVETI